MRDALSGVRPDPKTGMDVVHGVRSAPPPLRGYFADVASIRSGLDTGTESLVQQHFSDEVDINNIMRRYGVTQLAPAIDVAGVYGDFTGIEDYDTALERIHRLHERFDSLPAEVREKFRNDPGVLLEYASTKTLEEMQAEFYPPVVSSAEVPPVAPGAAPGGEVTG